MGRPPRWIFSGQAYDICFRTRQGLPFVCTRYMRKILKGIVARVQRDGKVRICHMVWMGNHVHMIIVAKDKKACTDFYGEVQKQLTEAVKRLMGKSHLSLWQANAVTVSPLFDVESAIQAIAYAYANPAQAHLVECIEDYPGVSSWEAYQAVGQDGRGDAFLSEECAWVRRPHIERLPRGGRISYEEDRMLSERLEEKAEESHELTFEPNAWMRSLRVTSEERIREVNEEIAKRHRGLEAEARRARANAKESWKRTVKGAAALERERLRLEDTKEQQRKKVKKGNERMVINCLDAKLREYLLEAYKDFRAECRRCYEKWKQGDFTVEWPPGALYPPAPHTKNDFPPQFNLATI
ncbi:transposase [bacterium]|nr:transposase [bacterium]